jgi:glutaredoxin
MQITIFSTSTCPYCGQLKEYLDQNKIPYTEKTIDTDEASRKEMSSISGGFMGVPYTVIDFDDGRRETVVGFDKGKLERVLQINPDTRI